jgi:iron complex outermembrane receptor protein
MRIPLDRGSVPAKRRELTLDPARNKCHSIPIHFRKGCGNGWGTDAVWKGWINRAEPVCLRVARRSWILAGAALLAFGGLPAGSQQAPAPAKSAAPDLTQKSLEDLMNIEVTSVSKKAQTTSQTSAAVFVITAEEIRHSGAQNIPDLLRMVPGLAVAQIDGGKWAITARGFNGQYSNDLLVLIDGRTVYNSEFAGVFWDSQNVPLESIERIEVVRGPGAAVWGSNAVNGVINIITKSADDTHGGAVTAVAGNAGPGPDSIRWGGEAGRLGSYRVYLEGFRVNSLPAIAGGNGHDDWRLVHGGYRTDTALSSRDALTAEGEVYQGDAGELVYTIVSLQPAEDAILAMRDDYCGWNQLVRWKRTISPHSETSLQVYYDRWTRGDPTYNIGQNTFDIDFQHHIAWGARQDIVWGLGYRVSSDDIGTTARISATPQYRVSQLYSSFAQDEITILPQSLHLTVGARLEHNDYTGFNIEPSARLAWTLNSKNMLWGAVSAADRTPARLDTGIRVNYAAYPGNAETGGLPMLISIFGNPQIKNERLTAYEAGYRNAWTSRLSVDLTAFYNGYRDLLSVEPQAMRIESDPAPTHVLVSTVFGNQLYGEAHGIEVFANWKPIGMWTLSPGYAYYVAHMHTLAGSHDTTTAPGTEGGTPDHQAQLRSSVRLPWKLEWNTSAFFVNCLPAQAIPSYTRLDSGINWRAGEHIAVVLAGQNLLRDAHPEYNGPDSSVQSGMMRRDAYAKITWTF